MLGILGFLESIDTLAEQAAVVAVGLIFLALISWKWYRVPIADWFYRLKERWGIGSENKGKKADLNCTSCGHRNREGATSCSKCGSKL